MSLPERSVKLLVEYHKRKDIYEMIVDVPSYKYFVAKIYAEGGIHRRKTYAFTGPVKKNGMKSRFFLTNVQTVVAEYHYGSVGE